MRIFPNFIKQFVKPDFAVRMIEATYKLAGGVAKEAEYQKLCQKLESEGGLEVLCRFKDDAKTNQYGYKAIAFIDRQMHEVWIATAGTELTERYDLWDNFKLIVSELPLLRSFISSVPNKLHSAKFFLNNTVDAVYQAVGSMASEYTFGTRGHSLGAVMSDLTIAEMVSRGLKISSSITFENPGSREVVERAIADRMLSGEVASNIGALEAHCEEYNAKRNFINNFKPRLGAVDVSL